MFMGPSCAGPDDALLYGGSEPPERFNTDNVPEGELLNIGLKFMGFTRSPEDDTRIIPLSSSEPTPVAHLVVHDNGFVIIASCLPNKPVLAYSDRNSFDISKITPEFIDAIELSVLEEARNSQANVPSVPGTVVVAPPADMKLSQDAPFNQVVDLHYPGCKTGCLPVAAATLLANTRKGFVLGKYRYDFTVITSVLSNPPTIVSPVDPIGPELIINDGYSTWSPTYSGCAKAISQLVYELGLRMRTEYGLTLTLTQPEQGHTGLASVGATLTPMESFNQGRAMYLLDNGWLLLQNGINGPSPYAQLKGHAWAITGYSGTRNSHGYSSPYFYCDLGDGGKNNGYYRPSMFASDTDVIWNPTDMWGVKKEF